MNSNDNWKSKVRDILEKVYPGSWDVDSDTEYYSRFYIHYPHIRIVNSHNKKHDIYDLYVRLRFRKESGKLYDIEGNRATYSQAEYESNYAHSHLSSAVVRNATWGGFCTGAEEITQDIYELQSYPIDERETLFEAVLVQLEIFLAWESLEGGPYVKIENISRRSNMPHIYASTKREAYNRFIGKYDCVKFNIQLMPPSITIDPFDEDFMDKVLPLVPEEYLVRRDNVTGEFFKDGSTQNYSDKDLGFSFKGKPVIRKVKNENEQESDRYYPHPEILRWISERIERKLTLHALSKRKSNGKEADGCIIAGVMVQNI